MSWSPTLRAQIATWPVVLLAACSSGPASGPADAALDADTGRHDGERDAGPRDAAAESLDASADAGTEPLTAEALADQLADAECGWLERCRQLELAELGGPQACRSALVDRWQPHVAARSDLSRAATQAAGCGEALRTAQCWQAPRALGEACWPIRSGGRPLDAACARSEDCADGYCRSAAPGLECGQCVAWRGLFEPCGEDPDFACGPHAICEDGQCRPLPAIAARCDGRCRDALDCVVDPEATICLPPLTLGDTCTLHPTWAGRCPEERLLGCIDGACTRATLVDLAEPCDAQRWCRAPEQVCGADGRCQVRPRAELGMPCEVHLGCAETAYCEAGRCVGRRTAGEACAKDQPCAAPLACLGAPATCRTAVVLDCR